MEFLRCCCHGNVRQHYVVKIALIWLLGGVAVSAHSAENDDTDNGAPEAPNLELLEFLGQFETDEGQWIDPDSLLTDEFAALLQAAINNTATDNTNNQSDN